VKLLTWLVLGLAAAIPLANAPTPIACRIDALNARERGRRETLVKELMPKAKVEEREDGYRLEWAAAPKTYEKLVEFIGYERRCCPFFNFEVSVAGPDAPVAMVIHGTPEVKAFIKQAGLFEGNP
jgi:hypothetical protein